MICVRRPAQIVSVAAIDHSDSYEVVIDSGGRQECLSIEASMLDMLVETWSALKSGRFVP